MEERSRTLEIRIDGQKVLCIKEGCHINVFFVEKYVNEKSGLY